MTRLPLLSLDEAQARLLALATPLPIKRVDTEKALGHYLAEPVLARRTQPSAHLSAMDGYAVRHDDLVGPWRVIGESAAGHPFDGQIGLGETVRISTGAIMPDTADAVILQEDVSCDDSIVTLTGDAPSPFHKHTRSRGMDFTEGAEIIAAGTLIGPAQLALAISAGHKQLSIRSAPRLLVIDSGDELAADLETCGPNQIPASNGAMLAAMARTMTPHVMRLGPVPDTLDDLLAVLNQGQDADIIVTSGGASVGDHDLVKPALEAWGASIGFWRVAIRPGKPILVATREHDGRKQIVLGLPGNPVSSHVTGYLFMLPLLRAMSGAKHALPVPFPAELQTPLPANGGRQSFVRATWDGVGVAAHPNQDSSALSALAGSNVLIDRPAHAPMAKVGEIVRVYWVSGVGMA